MHDQRDGPQLRAQVAQQGRPLGPFGFQPVQRAEYHAAPAQPGLAGEHPHGARRRVGGGQRGGVDDQGRPSCGRQGGHRRRAGLPARVQQVHRPAGRRGRGHDRAQVVEGLRVGPGVRIGATGQARERVVRLVVAEQMGCHPVRHSQGAGEQRALRVGDLQQTAGYQRGPGGEPEAAGARPGQSAQFEGERDGGAAAGQVVVEVAVELLEAGVEIGGEGHQQQVEVHGEQAEVRAEPGEPGAGRRGVRGAVHRVALRSNGEARRGGGRQDPLHRLRAEVLAAVRVVRVRIVGPAFAHRLPDPLLDPVQPLPQVVPGGRRAVDRLCEVEAHRALPRVLRPGGRTRSLGAAKPSVPGSPAPW